MGYSAYRHESEGVILIPSDRFEAAIGKCREIEGAGHISWAQRVEEYPGGPAEVLHGVLSDYGFDVTIVVENGEPWVPEEAELGEIWVETWGGDKLGSNWDDMWGLLAEFSRTESTWTMVGEDGEMWAERVKANEHHSLNVRPMSVVDYELAGKELASEDGENREYDRALVELIVSLLGGSMEDHGLEIADRILAPNGWRPAPIAAEIS